MLDRNGLGSISLVEAAREFLSRSLAGVAAKIPIGERRAATTERLAGMPAGYLVNPLSADEPATPAEASLAKDEAELLRRYRAASVTARRILLAAARATTQQKAG